MSRFQYQHSKTALTSLWPWSLQAKREQKTRIHHSLKQRRATEVKRISPAPGCSKKADLRRLFCSHCFSNRYSSWCRGRLFHEKFYPTVTLKHNYWWHLNYAKLPNLGSSLATVKRNAIVDEIAIVPNLARRFRSETKQPSPARPLSPPTPLPASSLCCFKGSFTDTPTRQQDVLFHILLLPRCLLP